MARKSPVWRERDRGSSPGEGVGVALGYWPGATNAAAAACRMSPDGSVQVMTGIVDMSGVAGGFQAIVADTLGHRSRPRPDRRPRLRLGPDLARQRRQHDHVLGRARDPPGGRGRRRAGCSRPPRWSSRSRSRTSSWSTAPFGRGARPERAIPIAKLVRANARAGREPIEAHGHAENPGIAPSVAGHVARVRVDRETGAIEVLEDHVVQDVGRVLNPALVAGQQHGARGAGDRLGDARGARPRRERPAASGTFLDYAMPRVGGRRAARRPRASRCLRPRGRSGRRASARRR